MGLCDEALDPYIRLEVEAMTAIAPSMELQADRRLVSIQLPCRCLGRQIRYSLDVHEFGR